MFCCFKWPSLGQLLSPSYCGIIPSGNEIKIQLKLLELEVEFFVFP